MSKRASKLAVGVVAAVLASVAFTAVASAGFKTGKYKGKSEQTCFTDDVAPQPEPCPIKFKATKLGVKKVALKAITVCDDDTALQLTTTKPAKAPLLVGNKFVAEFRPAANAESGVLIVVEGKLKRKKAKGTIQTSGTNESGAACSSSTQWKAKKQ